MRTRTLGDGARLRPASFSQGRVTTESLADFVDASAGATASLVSRHVSCMKGSTESGTCLPTGGGSCDCDEYPFGTTWNGAWAGRTTALARYIDLKQNRVGGTRLVSFYQAERVLDYTANPGITFTLENAALSIPPRAGGDDFWVHID